MSTQHTGSDTSKVCSHVDCTHYAEGVVSRPNSNVKLSYCDPHIEFLEEEYDFEQIEEW